MFVETSLDGRAERHHRRFGSPDPLPGQTDSRILLPYFTMRKMFPQTKENLLFVQPKEGRMASAIWPVVSRVGSSGTKATAPVRRPWSHRAPRRPLQRPSRKA